MIIHKGKLKSALLLKTNPFKLQNGMQKRGGVHEFIGYRFFFTLFIAFFVCLSVSLPGSWGRQLEYDFKLPRADAAATREAATTREAAENPVFDYLSVNSFIHAIMRADDSDKYGAQAETDGGGDIATADEGGMAAAEAGGPAEAKANGLTSADEGGMAAAESNGLTAAETGGATETDEGGMPKPRIGVAGAVIIDAGHGGSDPGSIESGICEKDIVFDVAQRTAEILSAAGVSYAMTRAGDDGVELEKRIQMARDESAAFLVSIHCDWFIDKDINGTSTLYNEDSDASQRLAALMQSGIVAGLGTADHSIHPHKNVLLLREARIPAVVIELGFISNEHDLSLMKTAEFREQAARNIADVICAAIKDM
jgi:N-acetylmuramoyl-L-alanine amidase